MSTNIRIQRICQFCGNEFTAQTTITKYCSHKCNSRHYKAKVKDAKIEQSNVETKKILAKPIEVIKAKPFLSVAETVKLLGISRRTVYRMVERKEIKTGKAGRRTLIQRTEIDKLFSSTPKF